VDLVLILLAFFAISALSTVASREAWRRGYYWIPVVGLALVAGLTAWFWHLASIATGPYLAGLGEMLVAVALVVGPGMGMIVGVAAAISMPLGVGVGVLWLSVIVLMLSQM